jgi:hypothetical protein
MNPFRTLPAIRAPGDRARRRRRAGSLVRGAGVAALSFVVLAMLATSAYAGSTMTKKLAASGSLQPTVHLKLLPLGGGGVEKLMPGVLNPAATASAVARPFGWSNTIFYDGFENGMGNWALGGTPTWDISSSYYQTFFAGSYSAYCAGSSIAAPGPYVNNMDAWMVAGPLDLSTVTSATLWYSLFVDTEEGYDPLKVGVSVDDTTFYSTSYSGPEGFIRDAFDLTNVPVIGNVCGQSQVWIAFHFVSDATNTGQGAYVDEVSVQSGLRPVYVSMTAGPAVVGYNKPVTIQGTLTDTWMNPLAYRSVDLYRSTDNKNYSSLGTIDCTTGAFSTSVNIVRKTWFGVVFRGDSEYLWSNINGWDSLFYDDDIKSVTSRANLTPPVVPSRVRRWMPNTKSQTYWGTLKPMHSTAQNKTSHTEVFLQRYSGGRWKQIDAKYAQAYRNTTTATLYMTSWRLGAPGRMRMRAVHADADHAKTTSAWRYFRVL